MMPERRKNDFLSTTAGVLIAAVAANLLWGSAPACIKLRYQLFQIGGEDVMGQILFAGVRFSLAGLVAILLGSLMRRRVLIPKRSSMGMVLILAMTQTVIQYSFFFVGLSHAPSYKGSIISTTSVFFALLFAGGISVGPFWPTFQVYCTERMPHLDPTLIFIYLSCAGIPGCGFFTWLMGFAGDRFGLRRAFLIEPGTLVLVIAILLVERLWPRRNSSSS